MSEIPSAPSELWQFSLDCAVAGAEASDLTAAPRTCRGPETDGGAPRERFAAYVALATLLRRLADERPDGVPGGRAVRGSVSAGLCVAREAAGLIAFDRRHGVAGVRIDQITQSGRCAALPRDRWLSPPDDHLIRAPINEGKT